MEDALYVDGEDFVELVFGDINGWLLGCQYFLLLSASSVELCCTLFL